MIADHIYLHQACYPNYGTLYSLEPNPRIFSNNWRPILTELKYPVLISDRFFAEVSKPASQMIDLL